MRHAGVLGLGGLVLALLLALGVSRCQLEKMQERHAAAALRADSAIAAADTTRALGAKAQKLLGDSLAGVERRAVQVKQRADALDRALGRERIARLGLTTDTIVRTDTVAALAPTLGDSIRFHIRSEPFTSDAVVRLEPQPARLVLRTVLDSVTMEVRLGCGNPGPDGIRPATASVTGPRWLPLGLARVEQAVELCRSPALQPRGVSRTKWTAIGTGVGIVACYFICPDRQ